MKMRKIYCAILALALTLSLTAPALAGEGEVPQPETPPEEVPGWLLEPEGGAAADSVVPETPEIPETPDSPDAPTDPENPGETLPPAEPEIPEIPEVPENPETPEVPVTPPEEVPTQPPAWILPPEESPEQEPIQVPASEPPVIEVVVPDTGTVLVNPYRLPVELDGQETTEQIAGSTMILENRGNVAVDVSVSAIGSPTGGVVFTAQPPAENAAEKELFLYAEFQPLSDPVLRPSWSGWYSDSTNQILVSAQGTAKADVLRLEAGGAPYSWGAARLFGAAAACPAQPWEAGDGFHVNLAFTFTPAAAETITSDIPGGSEFDSALVLPPEQSPEPAPVMPPDPVVVPPEIPVPPDLPAVPDPAPGTGTNEAPEVPPDPVVVPPEAPVPPDLPAVPDPAPETGGDEEPEMPPVSEMGDVSAPRQSE